MFFMNTNKINPKKLLNSKWTALNPQNKEKHFMIVRVKFDDNQQVIECLIEAVMSKKQTHLSWRQLKDKSQWLQGWQ